MYSFHKNFKFKALGKTYKGFKVNPIDRVYYDEFQYKLCLQGNRINYDILALSELNRLLFDKALWHYRIQHTSKNINLYLNDKDTLDIILDYYKHTDFIEHLWGALDEEHIESLQDSHTEYVYRNKYWYGKYGIKIHLFRSYDTRPERAKEGKEIRDFIKGSFSDYRLHDTYSNNWYSNYLWLTQEEFDNGYPFLKLSYGDVISKIQKVKLMEK